MDTLVASSVTMLFPENDVLEPCSGTQPTFGEFKLFVEKIGYSVNFDKSSYVFVLKNVGPNPYADFDGAIYGLNVTKYNYTDLDNCKITLISKNKPKIEHKKIDLLDNICLDNYRVVSTHDGTVVRLFWFNNRWRLATNYHPNVFTNKIFGTTYGKMINDVLTKTDFDFYNKNEIHYFNLLHPRNLNIIYYPQPELVYLGTHTVPTTMNKYALAMTPEILYNQIVTDLNSPDISRNRGVLLIDRYTGKRIIIDNLHFGRLSAIKNNCLCVHSKLYELYTTNSPDFEPFYNNYSSTLFVGVPLERLITAFNDVTTILNTEPEPHNGNALIKNLNILKARTKNQFIPGCMAKRDHFLLNSLIYKTLNSQ
jgi:hypothetical protein